MKNRTMQTPLVRVRERSNLPKGRGQLIRIGAFVFSLVVISVILLIMHYNPLAVFANMIYGAFGRNILIQETIKTAVPLLITALGLSLAFRMKVWNIGGEGQILIGAAAATAVSIYFSDFLGNVPLLLFMALAAVMAAGMYGAIPAACKARWGTNETLLTLMFNYIALRMVILLQNTESWQDTYNSYPKIRMLSLNSRLPKVFGVHIGWIIAIILAVFYYVYVSKTKHGYEIKVIGDSPRTAQYAGINTRKVMIRTMFLSAALCGLAGYLQVAGADGTLSDTTAGGIGFTAITVAWMAEQKPVGMVMVSLFISMLERGAASIQTEFLLPASFAEVMTGIMLLFLMGSEFFLRYQLVFRRREEKNDC